jgi:hypothetical protein
VSRLDSLRRLIYKRLDMNRSRLLLGSTAALVLIGAAGGIAYRAGVFSDRGAEHWSILGKYCMDCHNAAEAARYMQLASAMRF